MLKAVIILSVVSLVELFAIILLVAMVKMLDNELHDMEALKPVEIDPYEHLYDWMDKDG